MKPRVLPVIDISPIVQGGGSPEKTAEEVERACVNTGFFYIINHGIPVRLQQILEAQSHKFFACPIDQKMRISMDKGGKAWRGYFQIGDELTSGKPDLKEGIYFGAELEEDHPKVKKSVPLHGRNLFPDDMPIFMAAVLEYISEMTRLGHRLMEAIAMSLGLDRNYFANHFTANPLTLFRIFHYPQTEQGRTEGPLWGVGEHTDYGLLTILKQDQVGGLQVKSKSGWIDAPPLENSFICNIGDMLDRMTGGYYRSTPHRVLNRSGKSRYSFPFFFDPDFDAEVKSIHLNFKEPSEEAHMARWDRRNVHEFKGTYGKYILDKVSRVFPYLADENITL